MNITITKVSHKGSNRLAWNIDCDGVPFGQIWTFKAAGEVHPYHAKPLHGEHKMFATYKDAETHMRGEM